MCPLCTSVYCARVCTHVHLQRLTGVRVQLGISSELDDPTRDGECTLPRDHRSWTAAQLSFEIAVGCIDFMRVPFLGTLAEALSQHTNVRVVADAPRRFCVKTGIESVRTKAELLCFINAKEGGGTCGHLRDVYPGFDSDLQSLAQDKHIYAIFNSDIGRWVGFPRHRCLSSPVDADVGAMWAQSALDSSTPAKVFTGLNACGLQHTACTAAPLLLLPSSYADKSRCSRHSAAKHSRRQPRKHISCAHERLALRNSLHI